VVFDKNPRIGGILRYGIPEFKLEACLIDRRLAQMQAEGVEFRPNSYVGVEVQARELLTEFDAVVLAIGSERPQNLNLPGRALGGIHFAMDFLTQQNHRVAGQNITGANILAKNKDVLIIGGGDTGSDCIGTAIRQGARSVTQLEIMPKPPIHEDKLMTWPNWPLKLRDSTSHAEGCKRDWAVATKQFTGGSDNQVTGIRAVRMEWSDNRHVMTEIAGSEFEIKAGLVLLAIGFIHPVHEGILSDLGVSLDRRGNVAASSEDYQTSVNKVFATGDARRGQSLVVWAIREGRQCARAVDLYLMGHSELPT
jgi:glutamate synthase (NADPH/NADH) small chain